MTEKFVVTGMTCAACAAHVERAANSVPGVRDASVNLMLGTLTCQRDDSVDPAAIVSAVTAAGYGAAPESEVRRDLRAEQDASAKAMGRRLLWSAVCLVPLFYLSMGHMMGLPVPAFMHTEPLLAGILLLVLTVPILLLNRSYFTVGFSRLCKGSPNMDSLVALGAAAGLVYSLIELGLLAAGKVTGMPDLYFESAGMILTLVTVGKYMEERSKGKTTGAITALLALAPESAVVRRDGKEITVPTGDIRPGETVIVRQGGRTGVDGTVAAGGGTVDESALTGESMPVEKTVGDRAVSATILTGGYLELTAERVGEDTTLSQIIRLMDLQAGESSMLYFFKADNLAPLALILGIVLIMFVRRGASRTMGTIACGFGILFMGLMYMNSAVANLQGSVSYLLTAFEDNYFLGFLAGVGVTGVIQSSSAVIGVIQSLASTVGLSFKGIFAVIIGVNIGDCLTTFLVSRIGANAKQIRTTLVHIIYNVFAALLIVLFLFIGRTTGLLSDGLWNSILNSGGIANVHCLFRLVPAVLLLPFSGLFANLAERLVPDKSADAEDAQLEDQLKELDPHLVVSPSLALDLTAKLVGNMSDLALHNYTGAVQQIYEFDPQRSKRIDQREHMLDRMTDASSQYVVAVSPHITLERDTKEQNFLLKAITAFERIGDLAVNITDNVYALRDMDKSFSPYAMEELRVVIDAVQKNLDYTVTAYKNDDMEAARQGEPLEEVIDEMIEYLKAQHVDRMTRGLCDILGGIQFQNILSNLERISDQCSDMAVYILERQDEEIVGQEHTYVHNLHHTYDPDYAAAFRSEYDTYFGRIRAIDHRTSPENQNTPSKPAQ